MISKPCCEFLVKLETMELWWYQSIPFWFFQLCSETYVEKHQGEQLSLGWGLGNMRKQKVGNVVKVKGSFICSFKKHLLSTSYVQGPVPGPGRLNQSWRGKEAESKGTDELQKREGSLLRRSQWGGIKRTVAKWVKENELQKWILKTREVLWQWLVSQVREFWPFILSSMFQLFYYIFFFVTQNKKNHYYTSRARIVKWKK